VFNIAVNDNGLRLWPTNSIQGHAKLINNLIWNCGVKAPRKGGILLKWCILGNPGGTIRQECLVFGWTEPSSLVRESGMSSFWASPVSPPMCFPTFSHIPSQIPTFTLQFRAPRWSDAQEVSRMHLACHHLTCYGSLWRASNTRNKIYFWLFKQLRVSLWLWVRLWVKIVRAMHKKDCRCANY